MAYVYRHIRLDKNIPFYIGVGIDNKGKYHRAKSPHGRNNFWKNIVRKTEYDIQILFESESYDEIIEKEKEFIKLYGRQDIGSGILVNMTDGGDGCFNHICSEETKKKIGSAQKGEKNHNYGKKTSEETKKKMSLALKGKKRPDLTGINHVLFGKKNPAHGLKLKGRKFPERSERFRSVNNPNYGKTHSLEIRAKMSANSKGKSSGDKNGMWGKKRPEVGRLNIELKGKKVIDVLTGEIYISIADASKKTGVGLCALKTRLNGKVKNNTNLRLLSNDI